MAVVDRKKLIEEIKARHEILSEQTGQVSDPAKLLPEAERFIQEIRQAGKYIPVGKQRDLLVSLSSFWATYVFQHSAEGRYPNTDLDPPIDMPAGGGLGLDEMIEFVRTRPWIALVGIAAVVVLVWLVGQIIPSTGANKATETAAYAATQQAWTQVASLSTEAASTLVAGTAVAQADDDGDGLSNIQEINLGTDPKTADTDGDGLLDGVEVNIHGTSPLNNDTDGDTLDDGKEISEGSSPLNVDSDGDGLNDNVDPDPGRLPTPTPEPTWTPTPTPTPEYIATPTTAVPAGVSVKVSNLMDGQEVRPAQKLVIAYANLLPGWSLHVLLQPQTLSVQQAAVTYYPLESYYVVPVEATSGEWSVEVPFGQGEALDHPEWYNLTLAVATSEAARKALVAAVDLGFADFPDEVLSLRQGITEVYTVFRGAYTEIDEVRLLYSAYRQDPDRVDLVAALPDGSDPQTIPGLEDLSPWQPSLSPDGKMLAFVSRLQTKEGVSHQLWVADSDGRNRTPVLRQFGAIERPVWSPDGRYIAYSAVPTDVETNVLNLFLYDTVTGEFLQLTQGSPSDRYPSWMPDSKALVFNSRAEATSTLGIFMIDIATGKIEVLYDTKAEESQACVSPDGTRVAFVSSPDATSTSNRDIYVLDLRSGEAQRVTSDEALDQYPAWHPDGRSVYFETYRTGTFTIWAVDVDGSNLRQVTFGPSEVAPFLGLVDAYLPKVEK